MNHYFGVGFIFRQLTTTIPLCGRTRKQFYNCTAGIQTYKTGNGYLREVIAKTTNDNGSW
jgi:hypothetical protein